MVINNCKCIVHCTQQSNTLFGLLSIRGFSKDIRQDICKKIKLKMHCDMFLNVHNVYHPLLTYFPVHSRQYVDKVFFPFCLEGDENSQKLRSGAYRKKF